MLEKCKIMMSICVSSVTWNEVELSESLTDQELIIAYKNYLFLIYLLDS